VAIYSVQVTNPQIFSPGRAWCSSMISPQFPCNC